MVNNTLSEKSKQDIVALWRTGTTTKANLCRQFDVSRPTVDKILKGVEVSQELMEAVDNTIYNMVENGQFDLDEHNASVRAAVANAARREISFTMMLEDEMYSNAKRAGDHMTALHEGGGAVINDYVKYGELLTKTRDSLGFRKMVEVKEAMDKAQEAGEGNKRISIVFQNGE